MLKSIQLAAVGAVLASGGALAAWGNEYEDNPETLIQSGQYPQFNAVGQVQRVVELGSGRKDQTISKFGHGTALNISPCLVLTNFHVPFGERDAVKSENYPMVYRMGYDVKKGYFVYNSVITPVLAGDDDKNDFSISRDPNRSGKRFGFYKPSTASSDQLVARQATVLLVSYPGDLGDQQLAFSKGRVVGIDPTNGNVMYTASSYPGSSGGAVFVIDQNGDLRLQGIHVGGAKIQGQIRYATFSEKVANEFLNIAEVFDRPDVNAVVMKDLISYRQINPMTAYIHVRNIGG